MKPPKIKNKKITEEKRNKPKEQILKIKHKKSRKISKAVTSVRKISFPARSFSNRAKKQYPRKKRYGKYAEEYNKELKRVKNRISRREKQGFEVSIEIEDLKGNVTLKDLNKLKRLTPEEINKKTWILDEETGDIITKEEYKKQKREERKKQQDVSDKEPENVGTEGEFHSLKIDNVVDAIKRLSNHFYDMIEMLEYINVLVDEYGEDVVSSYVTDFHLKELDNIITMAIPMSDGDPVYIDCRGEIWNVLERMFGVLDVKRDIKEKLIANLKRKLKEEDTNSEVVATSKYEKMERDTSGFVEIPDDDEFSVPFD